MAWHLEGLLKLGICRLDPSLGMSQASASSLRPKAQDWLGLRIWRLDPSVLFLYTSFFLHHFLITSFFVGIIFCWYHFCSHHFSLFLKRHIFILLTLVIAEVITSVIAWVIAFPILMI